MEVQWNNRLASLIEFENQIWIPFEFVTFTCVQIHFWKGMDPYLLLPSYGEIAEQAGSYSLGSNWSSSKITQIQNL